ncbi:zinc transporter ZntB [Wenxinia saemankumensis]|uniref:Zinc transporter n=1 Tax=Wenxinia saemankumensis TaxID=1447782 RepID=A0A1M6C505_9RHOB|nr:zinc transporter ZntB [Wenxinia saemankumensis]SHI56105.1 zinc transporter [Wenxinia saemankumensis]
MSDDFIHFAFTLGDGSAPLHGSDSIAAALQEETCAWVHLQADDPRSDDWIDAHLDYLPEAVRDALIADATRPRTSAVGDGVLLNVRGVNLNEGEDPEDMISVRIWADPARIVTLTRRPLRSVEHMRDLFAAGEGPATAGRFLAVLVEELTERIGSVVTEMDVDADALEDRLLRGEENGLGPRITDSRAAVVDFRRFLVPQREAIARLHGVTGPLLSEDDRFELQEAEDNLRRHTEVIESLRERLLVLKDEIASLSDARLNRNLYILSVVSAVFLPLGFLTGLMGINLAGMPGASWPPAFWVFTGALGALTLVLLALLWRWGVIRLRRASTRP